MNTAAPAISGTAQRTQVLSASSGSWNGVGDVLGYQWQRSADAGATWTNIAGATTAAYTLAAADEGDNIRVLVTATNPDGSAAAGSAADDGRPGGAAGEHGGTDGRSARRVSAPR